MSTMSNWKDIETRELLSLRADECMVRQLHGTARDAVVYEQIARRLQERGIKRTKMQVITKLKSLKKMYMGLVDSRPNSSPGVEQDMEWSYFQLCDEVWGLSRTAKAATERTLETSEVKSELEEQPEPPVCVRPTTPVLSAVTPAVLRAEDTCTKSDNLDPDDCVMSEQDCSIPSKRRKNTILSQVNSLITATMSRLKDMDVVMQEQEDARLKRLMDHEMAMQKNLMQEMLTLHRTISAENHQRQLELVDRIMSRVRLRLLNQDSDGDTWVVWTFTCKVS
ncbi:hypothetical protein WMY93_027745 [Mugilogobius chulae]|uniref:Myb/SANT-like DNA-binding domain-containing protein n=1 Tax=Mugilogobius chulae TaxID=88201 RepID=A0AAW0N5R2_9GOBI